ncbi:MAG: protein phosphatase, partial [Myxococcales bacterium]
MPATLDFDWLTPGLAVGARFDCEAVPRLATEHRIRAVVDLRGEDCDDEALLSRSGIAFLHLPTP